MLIWLFDVDGTLINTRGAGRSAMGTAISQEFDALATTYDVQFAGRTDRAIVRDLFAAHELAFSESRWERFCGRYLTALRGELTTRDGHVLPGVTTWLRVIAAAPLCHLGLLTGNMRAAAQLKLDKFELAHHFNFGGYGDVHDRRDHVASAALLEAQQHVRHENARTEVWVVGDTPHDIQCARHIGAKVIAVATGPFSADELQEHSPDRLLQNLEDTTPLEEIMREAC